MLVSPGVLIAATSPSPSAGNGDPTWQDTVILEVVVKNRSRECQAAESRKLAHVVLCHHVCGCKAEMQRASDHDA